MQINLTKLPWLNKRERDRDLSLCERLHLDGSLLFGIFIIMIAGLLILYSASNENLAVIQRQSFRLLFAFIGMIILAQIPPNRYRTWAPWIFGFSLLLLMGVLVMGHIGKGAQRWLSLGLFRFQPSEVMKIALPMMLAWYFGDKPLPPTKKQILVAGIIIIIPVLLIIKQPDLGTALLILSAGFFVLLLAGISWQVVGTLALLAIAALPFMWHFMHAYQRERVLIFLNPESNPLGAGYHIIQSKIAIGSGGIFGKGWLQGTQSHLQFLPEHATDFIFAVCGEEFGLIGSVILLALYLFLVIRILYIATQAQDTFTRILAGSLGLIFFLSFFINIGMVSGILPVVGVPLPLISYGGTSIVTVLASFGIVMSIHTHRKLVGG